MTHSFTRYFGLALTVAVIAASVAILNVTPASTAQAECREGTGGGGGGGQATPSGSATPSPSEEDDDPLPIPTLPGGDDEETATPSGSPSEPPGGGGSDAQRCRTQLTIKSERSRASSTTVNFRGKVKSQNSDCEAGRKIALKKKKKGADRTVGNTVSKRNGSWSVREPNARGRFFAKAAKRKVGNVNCLPGKSKTIRA